MLPSEAAQYLANARYVEMVSYDRDKLRLSNAYPHIEVRFVDAEFIKPEGFDFTPDITPVSAVSTPEAIANVPTIIPDDIPF